MIWLALIGLVILLSFGVVIFYGAPYLPTLTPQVTTALKLVDLKPGQTLLELGCGDGKVLIAAAKANLQVVGYELNPVMAFIAWLRTRRYRRQVTVVWANVWTAKWPPADGIFVFLLPKFMKKLDTKVMQTYDKPVKLVSFAFKIPNRQPVQVKDGVFLYQYPSA
jgi:SAM-dependent methyltransferase